MTSAWACQCCDGALRFEQGRLTCGNGCGWLASSRWLVLLRSHGISGASANREVENEPMVDVAAPRPRARQPTQAYGEHDEIYRDRVETAALVRRLDRAESARVMAMHDAAEALGL